MIPMLTCRMAPLNALPRSRRKDALPLPQSQLPLYVSDTSALRRVAERAYGSGVIGCGAAGARQRLGLQIANTGLAVLGRAPERRLPRTAVRTTKACSKYVAQEVRVDARRLLAIGI